jgi:hypothetical protein
MLYVFVVLRRASLNPIMSIEHNYLKDSQLQILKKKLNSLYQTSYSLRYLKYILNIYHAEKYLKRDFPQILLSIIWHVQKLDNFVYIRVLYSMFFALSIKMLKSSSYFMFKIYRFNINKTGKVSIT